MEEKLSFPVFPRIMMNALPSSFKRIAVHKNGKKNKKQKNKQNKALSFSQLGVSFHWIHLSYAT